MLRLTPLLVLLVFGCDAEGPPETSPRPPPNASAPEVGRPTPPVPGEAVLGESGLSEAEVEAVLDPARAALAAAGLAPLPLTLTDPEADGRVHDRVVDLLLTHLRVTRVRIGAHTDPRGMAEYNQRISQERAELVARALIDRGIACARIEAVGYGESRPIADAPMSAQRRIELEFVRVDETPVEELREDACGLTP